MKHQSKYLAAILATAFSLATHAATVIPGMTDTSTAETSTKTTNTTSSDSTQINRIAGQYANWAGSNTNAVSLVSGLRHGSSITLDPTLTAGGTGTLPTTSATFTPTTKPMGWGNVTKALSLAQKDLAGMGITNPTPQQLQAALTGGDITATPGTSLQTTHMDGVLTMRSQGMGWGQIAHNLNLKPGAAFKPANPTTQAHDFRNASNAAVVGKQHTDLDAADDHQEHLLSSTRISGTNRVTTAAGQATLSNTSLPRHDANIHSTHSTHTPISRVVTASGAPMASSAVYQHAGQGDGHVESDFGSHITTASGGSISAGLGNAGGNQGKAMGHGKN